MHHRYPRIDRDQGHPPERPPGIPPDRASDGAGGEDGEAVVEEGMWTHKRETEDISENLSDSSLHPTEAGGGKRVEVEAELDQDRPHTTETQP